MDDPTLCRGIVHLGSANVVLDREYNSVPAVDSC